ncbi:hypothetical protein [Vibrio metschnikovii]|uniref:Uncharacterized protein n=1 Tax=Vibrio metschnikovii TaxID=28172 RepID=A0A9X0UKH1_VIBME|nr:hypothetical protein [Vibrio metschnikovii]MBC5853039.1 hypothetical protein [Vibrio metschnikovii]
MIKDRLIKHNEKDILEIEIWFHNFNDIKFLYECINECLDKYSVGNRSSSKTSSVRVIYQSYKFDNVFDRFDELSDELNNLLETHENM